MSSKDALLQRLSDDVFEMDDEDVVDACQEYIDGGYEALDGIMEGLVDGMGRAGKMYEEEEYFVSDILLCADAMYAGVDMLKPHWNRTLRQMKRRRLSALLKAIHMISVKTSLKPCWKREATRLSISVRTCR